MASPTRSQSEHAKPKEPELGSSKSEELPSSSRLQKSKRKRSSVSTTSTPSKLEEEDPKGKRVVQGKRKGAKKEKKITTKIFMPKNFGKIKKQHNAKEGIGELEKENENIEQL